MGFAHCAFRSRLPRVVEFAIKCRIDRQLLEVMTVVSLSSMHVATSWRQGSLLSICNLKAWGLNMG